MSPNKWNIKGNGENYLLKLTDNDNNPINAALISFNIVSSTNTYSFSGYTNKEGIVSLSLNLANSGVHNIFGHFDGNSNFTASNFIITRLNVFKDTEFHFIRNYGYHDENFEIKLFDENNNVLSGQKVTIIVGNTSYSKTTNSNGSVSVKLPNNQNKVLINCIFEGKDFNLASNFSANASVYKKTYIYSTTYALLKGNYFKVILKDKDNNVLSNAKVSFDIDGKSYSAKTNSKGQVSIKVNIARGAYYISFSFSNDGTYESSSNSSTVYVIDPSGQFKKGLNVKTSKSVSAYLYGGGKAYITKSIKALAKSITSKYFTQFEKAVAIFNYVRDTLNYQYYANSLKGAHKTLKTKAGNCCDHTNLIVALCRAAKIPARYSHAQGCRFGSGLVTGHVWAQIYVGGTWYSADATSYRNSFGHIVNWNTNSYYSLKNYRVIPF